MLKKTGVVAALIAATLLAACVPEQTQKQGERTQEDIMKRAIQSVPVPQTRNFLTRESVAKWLERQDVPDRPHYVYVFSDMGQVIGYYVAQSRPVCTNTFMTPPKRTVGGNSRAVIDAPALDGVYYGSGPCDQWFFFDAATDAMIELSGFKIFTSDQPLALNAEPIRVKAD